jgi:MarR family multiple gene transcriptional regulator MgrA
MVSRDMMGVYIPMLHNQFKEQMNRLVGKIDLTTSQIHVLFYLKSRVEEEVIQKDIEETFNLTNPTVTGIIKRLEAKGFVTRTVSSKDARSKSIHLTEKSIAASVEMKRALHEANKKLFEGFTDEEMDVLEGCFKRMLHNLEGGGCVNPHGHAHKKENNYFRKEKG